MQQENQILAVNKQMHYAWVITLLGALVIFSCLGLGRFSLGMMLPSMATSLDLNYSEMGIIGTANFVGYMISVLLAGLIAKSIGARWTITLGLILVGTTMLLLSRTISFYGLMFLYTATGIGSGLANLPMMGLVSAWFVKTNRGRAAGAMLSGNGISIVAIGLLIPWLNMTLGNQGWRMAWLLMGISSIFIAGLAACFLRNDPAEKGLHPLGENKQTTLPAKQIATHRKTSSWTLTHLGSIYFLFGATYAVYVTFIVTAMVNQRGFDETSAGNFWAIVGALSIFSGPLFGWISDKLGRKVAMMIVYALFTFSYLMVAANLADGFLYASIAIFGVSVWSIPTIMSAAAGDYAGPEKAVKALGFITLFFGVGQITGPAVAGVLADYTGNFSLAFWFCALLSGIAVAISYFLTPPPSRD